jgi:DNA polymerase III alpha subunit
MLPRRHQRQREPTLRSKHLDESAVGRGAIRFDRGVRFGLAAIKNVGEGAVEAIIAARASGHFVSLEPILPTASTSSSSTSG